MLSLFQKKTSKGVKKEIHKCDTLPSKNGAVCCQRNRIILAESYGLQLCPSHLKTTSDYLVQEMRPLRSTVQHICSKIYLFIAMIFLWFIVFCS